MPHFHRYSEYFTRYLNRSKPLAIVNGMYRLHCWCLPLIPDISLYSPQSIVVPTSSSPRREWPSVGDQTVQSTEFRRHPISSIGLTAFSVCQVDVLEFTFSRTQKPRANVQTPSFLQLSHHSCPNFCVACRLPDRALPLEVTSIFRFQTQEFLSPDLTQVLSSIPWHNSRHIPKQPMRVM